MNLDLQQRFVRVLLPNALDRPLDYKISCAAEGVGDEGDHCIVPGQIVEVPFRRQKAYGILWEVLEQPSVDPKKIRDINRIVDGIRLSEADLKFIAWMARYTMNPLGMVARLFLSNQAALEVASPKFAYQINNSFSKTQNLTPKQEKVLQALDALKTYKTLQDLQDQGNCSAQVVKALLEKKAIQVVHVKQEDTCSQIDPNFAVPSYSPLQKQVITALKQDVLQGRYHCTLLDGVTGSGKTEVFFEAIAALLEQGGQVLVLVPEISLTPQLLERFEARFGAKPAQWHSKLTPAKRRETYRALASGEVKVLIGARSALFLPYAHLCGIIVDEEHEGSYKQEEQIIYHARDMAVARAYHLDIPIVLVSATPSLESLFNAHQGKYTHLKLHERHGAAGFPEVQLIDMRSSAPLKSPGGISQWISDEMLADLKENLAAGDQSLLFLNRRGYAPLTLCSACGERLSCPHCSAWLVVHRDKNNLQCHHCGFTRHMLETCPKCDSKDSMVPCGPGVERIEEEVKRRLPGARTLVMASDAFEETEALLEAISAIQQGAYDVVIGTQIMAKGHNFPHLTYVGVIDADLGLSGGDLRASERTFQLLQQVSGRCGRHDKPGRVALQTYSPDHPVLKAMALGDRDGFIAFELEQRQLGKLPPFSRLVGLIFSGKNEDQVRTFVKQLRQKAPGAQDIQLLGPVTAPLAILRGFHRWRFLLQAPKSTNLQGYITAWLDQIQIPSSIKVQIDIDPISFM